MPKKEGEAESDVDFLPYREESLRKDLTRLTEELDRLDLLVKSMGKFLDDGELNSVPFLPPLKFLFRNFLFVTQISDYRIQNHFLGIFLSVLDRYYRQLALYDSLDKKEVLYKFGGILRGFLNYLTTARAKSVLDRYYETRSYVSDYVDIEHGRDRILSPEFKKNHQTEAGKLLTETIISQLTELLSEIPGGSVVDANPLWGRVSRSQVQIEVFYGEEDVPYWKNIPTEEKVLKKITSIFGEPEFRPDSRHSGDDYFRFKLEELSCEIWVKARDFLKYTLSTTEVIQENPQLTAHFDALLRDEIFQIGKRSWRYDDRVQVFFPCSYFLKGQNIDFERQKQSSRR